MQKVQGAHIANEFEVIIKINACWIVKMLRD
jgi:hypothetical protein